MIYKRPDSPFWFSDVRLPDGTRKRVSLRTTDKREAAKKAARLEDGGATTEATLGAALGAYTDHLSAHRRAWADGAKLLAKKTLGLLESRPGYSLSRDLPLSRLSEAHLEALADSRRREGASAQTVVHELKVIRAACRMATRRGAVSVSVQQWPMPRLTPKTRYLSHEEWQRVYDFLDPARPVQGRPGTAPYVLDEKSQNGRLDVRDLLVVLTYLGGRWGEICALTWDRLDFAGGTARLWASKVSRERVVPIPRMALEALRMRAERLGAVPGAPVFPGRSGGLRTATARALAHALDEAGLNTPATVVSHGRATVHSLRHTYASWLLQGGADISEVKEALGHASLAMTLRYAHLARGRTVERLRAVLDDAR